MTILNVNTKTPIPQFEPWREWSGEYASQRQVRNPKKPIKLPNRTKYFDPSKDRTHVQFMNPSTYQSREIKKEGYETRLYYEFLYCNDNDGQTFFYTLTYNDAHIPTYLGQNCFDYEDLRYLLNGGFKKMLLRKYGTNFKYFVGAELGDGKGSRGMHNNPHYHVLFFLRDAENPRYPYVKISPEDFRHLVRKYWQGFDEDVDGAKPYQEAKFGIAREGEHCGLVSDFRAVHYVAKYVCKDIALVEHERKIRKKLGYKYTMQYKDTDKSYLDFFTACLIPFFCDRQERDYFTDVRVLKRMVINLPAHYPSKIFDTDEWKSLKLDIIKQTIAYYNLWRDYYAFIDEQTQLKLYEDIKYYRNRHTNKCRISQHVGEYALNFIEDKLHPTIPLPSKKGIKNRPIGLYYYRKMYTEIFTDVNGKQTRILNPLGIEYKCANIESQVEKLAQRVSSNLGLLRNDNYLYNEMIESDVNTDVNISHETFTEMLDAALENNNIYNICRRYAEFKLVYEDRFLTLTLDRDTGEFSFPVINLLGDFRRFITPSPLTISRSSRRLNAFLECTPEDTLPYYAHPYFLRYVSLFAILDLCTDYFDITQDDRNQAEAEKRAETKRFFDQQKLKQYYNAFSNNTLFINE